MAPRLALTLTLTLTLSLGCGGEKAKRGGQPTPRAELDAGSAPPPQAPTEPSAKPAPPQPSAGAPAELKIDEGKAPAAASRERGSRDPSAPMTPITLASFAPEITLVVGTPSLKRLIDSFSEAAARVGGIPLPPDPLASAREALRTQLHLSDVDWLASDRPLKLAIPAPQTWREGFIACLPIRGGQGALTRALGETLQPAEGHLGKITAEGRPVFLDLADDTLIVTSHPELREKLAGFIDGPLAAWRPTQPLAVEASVANINRLFSKELVLGRQMAGALGQQLSRRGAAAGQAAGIRAAINGTFDLIANTERLGLTLDPSGASARLSLGLRGVPKSGLAQTITELASRPVSYAKALSPDTWFGVLANLDSELTDADQAVILGYLTEAAPEGPGFTEQEAQRALALIERLSSLAEGDSALAFSAEGPFPAAIHSLSSVSDGDAAREALLALSRLLFDKLLAKAKREAAGGDAAALPITDFESALAYAKKAGAPLGLTLSAVDETRPQGVHTQGLVISIDWDTSALARRDPATAAAGKAIVGPRVSIAVASGSGRLALALGPHAVDHAAALAAGELAGGEPHLNEAARGSFLALSLRLGKLLRALSAFPSLEAKADALAKLPTAQSFVLEADSDGATLTATLEIPLDLLMSLIALGG